MQYQCNPKQVCQNTKTYVRTNMFLPIISVMRSNTGIENSVYYRYTDHLGTSNWITDTNGVAVQYLHYGPFGELLDEQSTTSYNERYRFTSKERDEESGYHYFGARYYTDHLGIWTSADPLLDKYPSISPYSYCSNNPLKFIDPDGRKFDENNKLIAFDFLNRIINKAKNTKNKLFLNELEQLCIDIDFMICDENTEYVFNKIDNNDKLQSVESSVKQCNNGLFLFTITYYDDETGIHELKHAGDYARGFLILFPNEEKNYNINHEIRAYKAQLAFCGSLKLYTLNYLYNFPIIVTVNSLSEITEEFVRSLSNSSILNEPLYLYLP